MRCQGLGCLEKCSGLKIKNKGMVSFTKVFKFRVSYLKSMCDRHCILCAFQGPVEKIHRLTTPVGLERTTCLEWYPGHGGRGLHCPWSWPWCPFKSFQLTLRCANASFLCKMKMALPFRGWNSRSAMWHQSSLHNRIRRKYEQGLRLSFNSRVICLGHD